MTHPIIVTGPQRSGTRLAAHIIARDTNRTFVDELDYTFNLPPDSVVQAPLILDTFIYHAYIYPDAQFVFMYRDPSDIVTSMKRIKWMQDYIQDPQFYYDHITLQYNIIDQIKPLIPNRYIDLQYDSLKSDPLFVTDRSSFTSKQHLPNTPNGPKYWCSNDYSRPIT